MLVSATDGPWIQQLGEHLISASAVGDFILTVAGTGIAFVGAVWLFRRQLRHDRDLFTKQLEADREFRRSEMRRQAAYRLGTALVEAGSELDSLGEEQVWELLSEPGFTAMFRGSPGAGAYEAHGRAMRELDLDKSVITVWSAKLEWWRSCQALMKDPRIAALDDDRRKTMVFYMVEQGFIELDGLLRDYGIALMRWDGEGAVPTIAADSLPYRPFPSRAQASKTLNEVIAADDARRERERSKRR